MPKRKKEEVKPGAPEWLATYGDMMTLLLVFFVLLFSMSSIDVQKFKAIVHSVSGYIGVLDSGTTVNMEPLVNNFPTDTPVEEVEEFKELFDQVTEFIEQNDLEDSIMVDINERGLLIRFLDKVLFDSGKADLKNSAIEILNMVSQLLMENERYIRIEGHTDNVPINTSKFPSNWELSAQRSSNVLHFLEQTKGINRNRLSVSGYADTKPIDTNDTQVGRQNNRRVDIIILRSSMDIFEP